MSAADAVRTADGSFGSAVVALQMASAAMNYVNSCMATLDGKAIGDLLIVLGEI
jgi:hypothetical protein